MKLSLKNIGKIGTASVEINGITVIAGENNTGKSTVGRALFAVFNSFYNIQQQIESERVDSIENLLDRMQMKASTRLIKMSDHKDVARIIVANRDRYKAEGQIVEQEIFDLLQQYRMVVAKNIDIDAVKDYISQIKDVLDVEDSDFLKSVLEKNLDAEFNEQICNIFSEDNGEIQLQIKDQCISVLLDNEGGVEFQNPGNNSLCTEVIYIDDPFVLDQPRIIVNRILMGDYSDHRYYLQKKIFLQENEGNIFDEIVAKGKFNSIYEKLSSVCSGEIVQNKRTSIGYKRQGSEKVLDVRNLSTGLKTFVILKRLLTNGKIEPNGTIILDEPEIHLHPEWQLLFAEIIVLIQKEFGVHVLLNTHSPYFLNAIEVYSAKHGIEDKCKYYLASVKDDVASIEDVTDNIEAIYSKLARPLQDLENVRGQLC